MPAKPATETKRRCIYGFALQESDMSSETPEEFAAEAQRQMREYAAAERLLAR